MTNAKAPLKTLWERLVLSCGTAKALIKNDQYAKLFQEVQLSQGGDKKLDAI